MEFLNTLLKAFIPMFVAVDIVGVLPFFVTLTEDMAPGMRRKVIRQSVVTALAEVLLRAVYGVMMTCLK